MPVIREVLRLVVQVFGFAVRSRRPLLWVLLVGGAVALVVAGIGGAAAPVLIYPML